MAYPHILPELPLSEMKRISPSNYYSLAKCGLKAILANNKDVPSLLPLSPNAYLGTAIHKIFQSAALGKISNEKSIMIAWESEIADVEEKMRTNWREAHMLPLSKASKNYDVKRLQCFSIVNEIIQNRTASTGSKKSIEPELWLESRDKKVAGIIDVLRKINGRVEIIEYKTGRIFEENSEEFLIKLEYQIQMKLYAALYFSQNNVLPNRLILIGIDKNETEVDFNKDECLKLLEEAKAKLENLNILIKAGAEQTDLAEPHRNACKFCNFRPACSKYWENREKLNEWPIDIRGIIINKTVLGNGFLRLLIDDEGVENAVRNIDPIRHGDLRESQNVILCNLREDIVPSHHIETRLTTTYVLNN